MSEYMILEAKPLSQADVDQAIKRAHELRSEATWNFFIKVRQAISKRLHPNVPGGSGLAHSS